MPISKLTDVCMKSSSASQDILQLFDDKCFKIVSGSSIAGSFCLDDFAFPVDGHSCLGLDVKVSPGELTIFDNEILTTGSPFTDLEEGDVYARGVIIKVTYPTADDDGDEILIGDKKVELWIEDAETLEYKKHPMYNLFMLFTNPKSNDPRDLINRIKIVNPNANYKVSISALIVYGNVQ